MQKHKMAFRILTKTLLIVQLLLLVMVWLWSQTKTSARNQGIIIGVMPPGKWNAITDVPGVLVGHKTIIKGDSVRTGVTAILPDTGNLFQRKLPAAIFIGNGFGKLSGISQVQE